MSGEQVRPPMLTQPRHFYFQGTAFLFLLGTIIKTRSTIDKGVWLIPIMSLLIAADLIKAIETGLIGAFLYCELIPLWFRIRR